MSKSNEGALSTSFDSSLFHTFYDPLLEAYIDFDPDPQLTEQAGSLRYWKDATSSGDYGGHQSADVRDQHPIQRPDDINLETNDGHFDRSRPLIQQLQEHQLFRSPAIAPNSFNDVTVSDAWDIVSLEEQNEATDNWVDASTFQQKLTTRAANADKVAMSFPEPIRDFSSSQICIQCAEAQYVNDEVSFMTACSVGRH